MFPTCIDKVVMEISSLKQVPFLTCSVKERIENLEIELGFLKMFIWLLPRKSLQKSYIRATVGKGTLGIYGTRKPVLHIDLAVSKLLQKVEICKKEIGDDCIYLLDSPSGCIFSNRYKLLKFMNCTLRNLRRLVRLKGGAIFSFRMQVGALIEKLRALRDFVKSTKQVLYFGSDYDIQNWSYKIGCLSMIYWVDRREEITEARMKAILIDLLKMVKPFSLEVTGLWVRVLEVCKTGQVVASFVDFLLPFGFMKFLRQDLIFLITFLMHPHPKDWNLVVMKAKSVAREIPSLICSLIVTEMNQEIQERNLLIIRDFQEKIDKVKAEARELLPESLMSHFPATNALGFIHFLLEKLGNLKDKSISKTIFLPSARDQLLTLHQELLSLSLSVRLDLKNIQHIQNEFVELKDLWIQITDAAYKAEHVTDSCQIFDVPIWYNALCLSDAIEEVKLIKGRAEKIMNNSVYNNVTINAKVNSGSVHLGRAYTSRLDEVVVGLKDEAETIINRLTSESKELEIISIVGMPGQGKTTLAQKIYNSPSIQHHFHKRAWCFVTQVYEEKRLYLDILRDVTGTTDDKVLEVSKEDLAQKLYRCLKGERYLIIMDDIWDIEAWNVVHRSFPNDKKGSRILFTSRNRFVPNLHLLRPLNDMEGEEFLKQKIFPKGDWPSNFSDDVKKVLKVCKGLPLSIVVVAGLLKKVSNDFEQWREIVRTLNPKLASEGCMDILELSYKNLPDYLRPCFLYLGAVGKNKVFKAHKLIHLWIAEGFVRKSQRKSQEELGREYLEDLIGRSLVIVHKNCFSSGEIKECRIHDLLLEFCLVKAEEERFIHFSDARNYSPDSIIYNQYRLCIFDEWVFPSCMKAIGPNVRSLLTPIGNSLVQFPNVLFYHFFDGLKFLRVLDLGTVHFKDRFPHEVLHLICLRYLSIMTWAKVVPSSIGNLCNLEYFHVVRLLIGKVRFPRTIWKIKTLRHVDVGRGTIVMLDDHGAANVCHQLGNLDSISSLYLSNVGDAEKLLGGFPRVRKLKLEFSESWDCRGNCDHFQVLHSLIKLESLNLKYSLDVAGTCALNLPTTLKQLTLSQLHRPWSEISTIGKLPKLEILKLDSAVEGEIWDVADDEFGGLKHLQLSRLDILRWEASTLSFPCLERLVVRDCPFLVEFPSIFKEDVLTLKMIKVQGCLESLGTSAESIGEVQRDLGNKDLEVVISNVIRCNLSWRSGLSRYVPEWKDRELYNKYIQSWYDRFSAEEISSRETPEYIGHILSDFAERRNVPESLAFIKRRNLPSIPSSSFRRTKLLLKHNCQPRHKLKGNV